MTISKEQLFDTIKSIVCPLFPEIETEDDCKFIPCFDAVKLRVSWKTHDNPESPNKRVQPIIITFSESTIEDLSELPIFDINDQLSKQLTAFIIKKRSEIKPRYTDSPHQFHTPEEWVFIPKLNS